MDLSTPYPLDPQQVDAFRRDGHVVLRRVCSPDELAWAAPTIRATVARLTPPRPNPEDRDTFAQAFLLSAGLWNRDPEMARFTLARRFAAIAAALMGVPAVRLYHDVALFKEPGDAYTPWHQDAYYWPMETPHTVTMWMPLVDIIREMGALIFASGSHREGDLGKYAISDDTHAHFDRLVEARGWKRTWNDMAAGDATFHNGWTLHSAPPNTSVWPREVITVVYYADGARTYADAGNPHRQWDWDHFMPGVGPGEIAASPRNPVVFGPEAR